MQLRLAAILSLLTVPAWGGALIVADPPTSPHFSSAQGVGISPSIGRGVADGTLVFNAPKYARLYEAPLFGNAPGAKAKVDESALRFYAAQRDRTRVNAEIARLRVWHSDWQPPSNLFDAGDGSEEKPLWALFGAGRINELAAAIREREHSDPAWRPSADLSAKIARRDAAARLAGFSGSKQWERVLEEVNGHADLLSCADVDTDWKVAEAFVGIALPKRAFEIDAAILASCTDPGERLATVRKSVALLAPSEVEALLGMGHELPGGHGEFDVARLDLTRKQIGDALSGTASVALSATGLAEFAEATSLAGNAADAGLLGWFQFARGEWAKADGWFKLALQGSPDDAKIAEGHARSLRKLLCVEEAERLAAAWGERSTSMRILFIDVVSERLAQDASSPPDPGEVAEFTKAVSQQRSVTGAAALAWSEFRRQTWSVAADWFAQGIEWAKAADNGQPLKLVEGYALALQHLGRAEEAEAFVYERLAGAPELNGVFASLAEAALSRSDPPAAISSLRMDRFAAVIRTEHMASGASAYAWRQLADGRPEMAVEWFRNAIAWASSRQADPKVAEGFIMALVRANRYAEAEEEAYTRMGGSVPLRAAYVDVLVTELLSKTLGEQLSEARIARFVAVVVDLRSSRAAEAIGWFRLRDEGCGYAVDWFRLATAWSADHKGTAKSNEGLSQALQRTGDSAGAGEVALASADDSRAMKALYVASMVDALTREFPSFPIPESRISKFAEVVRAERSVMGAQALAWHRYRDAGNGYAVDWFADAMSWSAERLPDLKSLEGYASALKDVGRLRDAEEALYPAVTRSTALRDRFIDVFVSELTRDDPPEPVADDRLLRFVGVALPLRSAGAAQALGWYRLARHEDAEAVTWFKNAIDWWPTLPPRSGPGLADGATDGDQSARVRVAYQPADYIRTSRAFSGVARDRDVQSHSYVETFEGLATTWTGYALALRAAGRPTEAEDVAFAWQGRWPALAKLYVDLAIGALTQPPQQALDPDRLKRFAAAIEEARNAPAAAALGWYWAGRHDATEASVWLKAALEWRPNDGQGDLKLLAGYADELRQAGRPEEALAVVAPLKYRDPGLQTAYLHAALDVLSRQEPAQDSTKTAPDSRAALLAQVTAVVANDPGPASASALAWHYQAVEQPEQALPWFKAAIERAGDDPVDPKAVEGFALTLRALGRRKDALTFMTAWQDKVPSVRDALGDVAADVLGQIAPNDRLPADFVARLEATADTSKSPRSAAAIGWSLYGRRDWAAAAAWFRKGMDRSPEGRGDGKLIEGYVLSLRNLCRLGEARDVVTNRMDGSDGEPLRRLYVSIAGEALSYQQTAPTMDLGEARRFAAAVMGVKSADGAQSLGWYAYHARQYAAAAAWFEQSLQWGAAEPTAFGLAMARRKLGDAEGLSRVLVSYEKRYASLGIFARIGLKGPEPAIPRFEALAGARSGCLAQVSTNKPALITGGVGLPGEGIGAVRPGIVAASTSAEPVVVRSISPPAGRPGVPDSVPTRGVIGQTIERKQTPGVAAAAGAKDHARCLALLDRGEPAPQLSERRLLRGWCLMELSRPAEAAAEFAAARAATNAHTSGDAAFGESLALLRGGDTNAAEAVAAQASLTQTARASLGIQLLSQQAYDAYKLARWEDALDALNRRRAITSETRDLVMLRGWALYHLGEFDAAKQVFASLETSDAESRSALAVATAAAAPKVQR